MTARGAVGCAVGCVVLGAALALACAPDVEPIRWDELDIDALREQLDNPTGEVTQASADEVAAEIVRNRAAYLAISDYLDRVFLEPEAGRLEPLEPLDVGAQQAEGTSVFALFACPGEDPAATDVGFAHGTMRVDSPRLTRELVEALAAVRFWAAVGEPGWIPYGVARAAELGSLSVGDPDVGQP